MNEATESAEAVNGDPERASLERASLADWLAVAAGTLGALMALLDTSVVNASLPVVQGEIGATPTEGTWIGTAYLISEIIVIPLTAWLERLFGLRYLLLGGAFLFTLFSVICGTASDLGMMVFGRVGQGLAGGVLIPTALTIVARRLPSRQQSTGLAIVACAALVGPIAGPVLGGWLTERFSWHIIFFMNVPMCLFQGILLMIAIPKSARDWHEFWNADWFGIAGMVIGLGSATTFLEEGHRELWFESALIWKLAASGVLGFLMIGIGQFRARPVIRLSLLRNKSLSSAVMLLTVVGMLLYSCLFLVPQFLAAVAGYNSFQSGQVLFISGLSAIGAAVLYGLILLRLDMRLTLALALLCVAVAAFILSSLTSQSAGEAFIVSLMLYGVGTTLASIPLQQAVIASVSLEDAAEANSLSAVARNVGGSLALAAIASFADQRLDFHHWQLNASLGANDIEVQRQLADATSLFGGGAEGLEAAYRALDGQVTIEALVMSFNDMFLVLAVIGAIATPLVMFLRPATGSKATMSMH